MTYKLHSFFRSSASTRLRAALNLKGIDFEYQSYVLRKGENRKPEYLAKNPQGLVPMLEREDGTCLTQSLSIMEWLDETHPTPSLLPADADGRARVRSLSYMIACEIHPLNNLRVLFRLRDQFDADEEAQKAWFTHWVTLTFDALEAELASSDETGAYCHGDTPTMADCCVYAQVWNNSRFGISLDQWPTIKRIYTALHALEAFEKSAPPNQPDAQ